MKVQNEAERRSLLFDRLVSRRRFLKNTGIATLGAASIIALGGCSSPSNENESSNEQSEGEATPLTDENLPKASWDDILAAAKGETITYCAWGAGGADALMQKYWEKIRIKAKDEFDITINYVEDTAEYEERFISDYVDGLDATIDMFWGASYSILYQGDAGVLWGDDGNQWVKALPNSAYLDWTSPDVNRDGAMENDYYQAPFMRCSPCMVYDSTRYDASLAWDEEGSDGRLGLFHNLTELYQWVQKYPGKFTYLDLLGVGGFHGSMFVDSILYELTNDENGSWTTIYEEADDAQTRSDKIQKHAEEWFDWACSDEATQEAFEEKSAYVWAYLNDLKPFLFTIDGEVHYGADAYEMIGYVGSGDIATSFTTNASIYPKTQSDPSYLQTANLYMMQTSVGYSDFNVIAKNSQHKAACMVVCNLLLSPEMNADIMATSGNPYDLDLDKLSSDDKKIFTDMLESFPEGTAATSEDLALKAHNVSTGSVDSWLGLVWDEKVVHAS